MGSMDIDLVIARFMEETQGSVMNIFSECPARDVCPSMEAIFRQRSFVVYMVLRSKKFNILHLELISVLFDKYVIYSILMFKQSKVIKRSKSFDGFKLVNAAIKSMQKDNERLRLHYQNHNATSDFIKKIDEMINVVKNNHK